MAQSIAPRSVHRRRWAAEGVTVSEVVAQLGRLCRELASEGPGEQPQARTSSLNLVARTSGGYREVAQARQVVSELSPLHPLRAVIVHVLPRGAPLAAEILCDAPVLERSAPLLRQEMVLTVGPEPARRLPELVAPLLAPGVPTFVWWMGTPPLSEPELIADLETCHALILDSLDLEPLGPTMGEAARFVGRGRTAVGDLLWPRLRPWREALASFFTPPARRPFAYGIERIRIAGPAGARGQAAAALLLGWLAARLDYRLAAAGQGRGLSQVRYEAEQGRVVEVEVELSGQADHLRSLSLAGAAQGQRFELEVRRERAERGSLRFQVARPLVQELPWATPSPARLLAEVLVEARRDALYPQALAGAAHLLEALT